MEIAKNEERWGKCSGRPGGRESRAKFLSRTVGMETPEVKVLTISSKSLTYKVKRKDDEN